MKYLLALSVLLFCCASQPAKVQAPAHPNTPHSHFTEAQVESATFSFWAEIARRTYKCYSLLGIPAYFIHTESAKKNFGSRCVFTPEVVVVDCHNSVGTNHLINNKVIYWECSTYLIDDYVHVQVSSEYEIQDLVKGVESGEYGF